MQRIIASSLMITSLYCGELHLEVNNIPLECNTLKIGLFDSKEHFPIVDKALKGVDIQTINTRFQYTFSHIPKGTYALALFCDENHNDKHDTNFFGIPKEAYGVSNNPKVFGKPGFDDTKFEFLHSKRLVIEMQK